MTLRDSIIAHWSSRIDAQAIDACLSRKADCALGEQVSAVASLDQLHAGLAESTLMLARLARIDSACLVLDLGAGLGGPARCLAQSLGCRVVALDVTPTLVEQGRTVTARLGLSHLVTHICADAASARLEERPDVVWIQHVDMQVPDKLGLYRVAAAQLAPRGRVAWHDWLAGSGGAPTYPLMWSPDGSMSFLSDEATFRENLHIAGLELEAYATLSDETCRWFGKTLTAVDMALSRESEGSARRSRLERLEIELQNVIASVADGRLVPFFAVAGLRMNQR